MDPPCASATDSHCPIDDGSMYTSPTVESQIADAWSFTTIGTPSNLTKSGDRSQLADSLQGSLNLVIEMKRELSVVSVLALLDCPQDLA